MPQQLDQLASANSLGIHKKTFRPRILPGRVLLGVTIFSLLMSTVEFVTAVNKRMSPPSELLSDKFRQDSITVALILGCVFVLVAMANGFLFYVHKKHRVDLYENGFIVSDWRRSMPFPWTSIADFEKESVRRQYGRDWELYVTREDGEKVVIRGLVDIKILGDLLEKETFSA